MSFQKGQEVYDAQGHSAEYIGFLDGIGHFVRPIYDRGDSEPGYGNPTQWKEIFESPPTEKYQKQIAELIEQRDGLRKGVKSVQLELEVAQREHRNLIAKLKKFKALNRIEDFVEGKITHYAVFHEYRTPYVVAVNAEISGDDSRYSRDLKLLTLFGKSNGDLEWRLSYYSDGSGSSYYHVYPCCSEEEAVTMLKAKIVEEFTNWVADPNGYRRTIERYVEAAKKYEVPVPEAIQDYLFQHALNCAEGAVTSAKKALDEATAKRDALLPK